MSINSKDVFTWPTNFSCVLVLGDMVLPNEYNLTISMLPNVAHNDSTMLGLKKIKLFLSKFVQNATLIQTAHPMFGHFSKLSTNVVQLPQDPHDYFFASLLYKKLAVLSEDYFTIHNITIDSSIGDHVQYQITTTCDAYDNILESDNWWNHDNTKTNNFGTFPTWDDLNVAVSPRFSPVLLRGGKDESKSVQRCNS